MSSDLLGVVLLIRHGDREGFYQNPFDYTASNTAITPFGNTQEFQLGQLIRSIYFDPTSPSFVPGVDPNIVKDFQLAVRADAGGERGVIFNSAVSLLQGLFPPNSSYTSTLSNGTVVEGPLGGYQTVPIESVEPNNDFSLEGWTSCNTFNVATSEFYNSTIFKAKAAQSAGFLSSLEQYVGGRQTTLENMWNLFDFMNVQSTYNATFANALPPTYLAQARDLANFHEYGVFTSPQLDGIGNIAGQTILPSILSSLHSITNASDPLKFMYTAISYKPFLSLFNMTGVAQMNPQLATIVNYAAAVALEVRQPAGATEPVLRFNFKNGTQDTFNTYPFMNSTSDVPLSTFVNYLTPVAFSDPPTWCSKCDNWVDRGCSFVAQPGSQTPVAIHQAIGPVGAGFLGAGLTIVVCAAMLGMLAFLGVLTFGKKRTGKKAPGSDTESLEKQ